MKKLYEETDGKDELSPWDGKVWAVKDKENEDLEFFSSRPVTPGVGGDEENWPREYEVYEGNVDGGDSVIIEYKFEGVIHVPNWREEVVN